MTSENKFISARLLAAIFTVLLVGGAGSSLSLAQTPAPTTTENQPTNAFQGFTRNRKDPVNIEANTLEVRDKEKIAFFKGNVVVVQGDTTMRSRELEVHYEGNALGADPRQKVPATKNQQKSSDSAQRIKKLIAVGGVIVVSKDQRAVGDKGTFDMATNIVVLDGNVVVTQGQNVIHGEKLTVNLTTGTSQVHGVKQQGATTPRVKGVFVPSSMDKDKKDKKDGEKPPRKKQPPGK
jgi:lipopolysaccharide export system protein LptA